MKLNKRLALAVIGVLLTAAICVIAWQQARQPQRCPAGLSAHGARCCGVGQSFDGERCVGPARQCATNMNASAQGCAAQRRRISVSGGELHLAPSDWEAQGRVRPRRAQVLPFAMDSHEATERDYAECVRAKTLPDGRHPWRGRTAPNTSERRRGGPVLPLAGRTTSQPRRARFRRHGQHEPPLPLGPNGGGLSPSQFWTKTRAVWTRGQRTGFGGRAARRCEP